MGCSRSNSIYTVYQIERRIAVERQEYNCNSKVFYTIFTILFFGAQCLLSFSSFALAGGKIHLDKVPYVVQKERLD